MNCQSLSGSLSESVRPTTSLGYTRPSANVAEVARMTGDGFCRTYDFSQAVGNLLVTFGGDNLVTFAGDNLVTF